MTPLPPSSPPPKSSQSLTESVISLGDPFGFLATEAKLKTQRRPLEAKTSNCQSSIDHALPLAAMNNASYLKSDESCSKRESLEEESKHPIHTHATGDQSDHSDACSIVGTDIPSKLKRQAKTSKCPSTDSPSPCSKLVLQSSSPTKHCSHTPSSPRTKRTERLVANSRRTGKRKAIPSRKNIKSQTEQGSSKMEDLIKLLPRRPRRDGRLDAATKLSRRRKRQVGSTKDVNHIKPVVKKCSGVQEDKMMQKQGESFVLSGDEKEVSLISLLMQY